MQDSVGQNDANQERTQVGPVRATFNKIGRAIALILDWFEVASLSVGVALLAILLISNVIAREFFQSLYFAEEVSEFLVIFVTFVGLSYGARKARHIRMGAFFDMMGPRLEKVFIFVISAVNATVMFVMARYSFSYMLDSARLGQSSEALRLPYWIFLVIVPIGFFMAGVQYVRTIIKNIVEKETWLSPEQQSEYEDEAQQYY